MRRTAWGAGAALFAAALAASSCAPVAGSNAAGRAYYVSCHGNDNAAGSQAAPWRTIRRAEQLALGPGDKLLFQRGCTWNGDRLDVTGSGNAQTLLTIGNYGTGTRPVIKNGANSDVKITGSYVLVQGIATTFDPATFKTIGTCRQPYGNYYGFNVTGHAHDDWINSVDASAATAGIHLNPQTHDLTITNSILHGNNVMNRFATGNPADDLGAWGINAEADNTAIAYNTFHDNRATCQDGNYRIASNSVELYDAQGDTIEDNVSTNDRVFSELGGASGDRAANNTYAYNLFTSSLPTARFITTRGAGDGRYGPVRNTQVVHNTVYLTGPGSVGINCGHGCGSGILTLTGNIIWAETKVVYADGHFDEDANVYWSSAGDPYFQAPFAPGAPSVFADPQFVNRGHGNFHLRSGSPARGIVPAPPEAREDLGGRAVPSGNASDAGAYQYVPGS